MIFSLTSITSAFMKILYTIIIISSTLLTSACSTIKENHGAQLRPASVDQITPDSTKQDVRKALGSPSTTSSFGDETWYYISNQTERRIFTENEIDKQNVLAIKFRDDGLIDNVELYGLDDGRKFAFSDRITPTSGHDLTVIEQLLGNVGRFNNGIPGASQTTGSRRGGGSTPGG